VGSGQSAAVVDVPARAFDDALPEAMLEKLRSVFGPQSLFWQEHRYSCLSKCASEDVGYFSYTHELSERPCQNALDVIIRHILNCALPHFPDLKDARFAEWWAHCRPHASGHQMHFDSDDEGIGGARHPICSCVSYIQGDEAVGGPTLVTTQRLGDKSLASHGGLIFARPGRLCVFDGSVLHGVVPGRGPAPAADRPDEQRRVTWMVAFWRDVAIRPFGPDGLPGSSRPLPDPSAPLVGGGRTYTWHQALKLDEDTAASLAVGLPPKLKAVDPVPLPRIWEPVCGEATPDDVAKEKCETMPDYNLCFQF